MAKRAKKNPRVIIELDKTAKRNSMRAFQGPKHDPDRRYIAVAGNIGSGKSTFVEYLGERYNVKPFFEPNDQNPYLEDFYTDMTAWAFQSQVYFLAAKFALHQELDANEQSVIQDRTLWEDAEIFVENLRRQKIMDKRDYDTYRTLYESIQGNIRPPDLMIYLRCPVRTVRKRIAMRGREMEQDIPTGYLRRLHNLYEKWIENYTLSPLIIIPNDRLDYLTDIVDRQDLHRTIEKYL